MSRRLAAGVIAASVLLAASVAGWLASRRSSEAVAPASTAISIEHGLLESGATVTATLFFPGDAGLLYPVPRELPAGHTVREGVMVIVEALLAGPGNEELSAPFPEGTRLEAVDLVPERGAFVSLESPSGNGIIAAGSRQELLMIYSLVNSVALNVEGIERVALIWNGMQRPTLAGHVDTSRPLPAESRWIAGE